MSSLQNHGGGCCGISHRRGIRPDYKLEERRWETEEEINIEPFRKTGGLTEIVLNSSQVKSYPRLLQRMKDKGYRLVSTFTNTTGSKCYVFHYTGNENLVYLNGMDPVVRKLFANKHTPRNASRL